MKPLFEIGDAYEYGMEIAPTIRSQIIGRAIFDDHNAGLLAQAVYYGKHGDHVEIGSLYGASAILAAMVKIKFGMYGDIYCIDPLDDRHRVPTDVETGMMATRRLFWDNMEKFEVSERVNLVTKSSYPWPYSNHRFATAYIDGDHWGGIPQKDWESVDKYVAYMVVFDDYTYEKPDVQDACLLAAQSPKWIPVHISGNTFIVRRRE